MGRAARKALGEETYLNLVTFRRDGTAVETPVWCVGIGELLYVFTDGTSYKVKRLRRDPRVRVAACDVRGRVCGPWFDGTGRLVDDPQLIGRVYEELGRKYGWQMWLLDLVSRLAGRIGRRCVLELDVTGRARRR